MEKDNNDILKENIDNNKPKDSISKETIVNKKSKIVPSYAKKQNNTNNVKKRKGPKSNISKILLIFILLVVILGILLGIYKIIDYNENKKYDMYKEEMDIFGFTRMYNSGDIRSEAKVTKSEAVKIIISSVLNIYDISNIFDLQKSTYDNEIWVRYAESSELIPEGQINEKNQNSNISIIEFLSILSNVKAKLLEIDLDAETAIDINYKFLEKCSNEEQIVLKDMIYNKILVDVTDSTNVNKALSKGMCNEIILNFVKKYNTITINGAKININDEKLPSNVEDYPYILANVKKEVYEKKYKYFNVGRFKTAAQIYADIKEQYEIIDYLVNEYMDTILNIDYHTIEQVSFENSIKNVTGNFYNKESVGKYVEFVKTNHIVTRGNCSIQYPVIYYDGQNYRVRVRVVYAIDSADYLREIFYLDNSQDINYSIGESEGYYDIMLKKDSNGELYIYPASLIEMKL